MLRMRHTAERCDEDNRLKAGLRTKRGRRSVRAWPEGGRGHKASPRRSGGTRDAGASKTGHPAAERRGEKEITLPRARKPAGGKEKRKPAGGKEKWMEREHGACYDRGTECGNGGGRANWLAAWHPWFAPEGSSRRALPRGQERRLREDSRNTLPKV